MSEDKVVEKTKTPATIESLQTDLRALGVRPGMVVLVHSSLSAMGWVCGGSVAVVTALQKVLGSTGTLVMPAHSSGLSEPSKWEGPPVPESWWPVIREDLQIMDGYVSTDRYQVSKTETADEFYFILKRQKLDKSYVKRWSMLDEDFRNYSELVNRGLSLGAYDASRLLGSQFRKRLRGIGVYGSGNLGLPNHTGERVSAGN